MADTALWRDLRQPFVIADLGSITPTTTQKMLWTPGAGNPLGNFPSNYWTVGKTVKLTAAFKWTSGTAGNIAFGMAYGAADAAAVNVVSATHAAVASVGPFLGDVKHVGHGIFPDRPHALHGRQLHGLSLCWRHSRFDLRFDCFD
jgi:hypothetical protein